ASRAEEHVSHLYDPLHPSVLSAVADTVRAAHENGIWAGMCGEMAGDPDLTELLVGLGLDELSMSPYAVPRVKANVRDIEYSEARETV
ncbi:MAG: putative PEP-binding protein, partial [Candidatus Nanohaloarchaea archaeon]|nr:putative PEP-binding protein [Candidatus Nanohaloarchaea archaeon]